MLLTNVTNGKSLDLIEWKSRVQNKVKHLYLLINGIYYDKWNSKLSTLKLILFLNIFML